MFPAMVCLACGSLGGGAVCDRCRRLLRPAPDQYVSGVGVVRAAYWHRGPARLLVHHLKYRGVVAAGSVLAEAMAELVPVEARGLVPVTRVGWRRLRYGVDPALELALAVGRITGRPVHRTLIAPPLGKARAGGVHGSAPRFRTRREPGEPVLLVDDVVTTGATLVAAARLFPTVVGAVTATSSPGRRRGRLA